MNVEEQRQDTSRRYDGGQNGARALQNAVDGITLTPGPRLTDAPIWLGAYLTGTPDSTTGQGNTTARSH